MRTTIVPVIIMAIVMFTALSIKDYYRFEDRNKLRAITSPMIINAPCQPLPQVVGSGEQQYQYQCNDKRIYTLDYNIATQVVE